MRKVSKVYLDANYVVSLIIGGKVMWLQIGHKNFEITEKNNVFRKYDDKKSRKHAICQTIFPQPNP